MNGTLGEIRLFGGNFAPRNWAFCEGQLLAIASNTALFSILGTIYGGDGRTSFGLPDMRGRTCIGPGTGPGLPTYREGQRGGTATTILNATNLPAHNHVTQVQVSTESAEESSPTGKLAAASSYNEDPTSSAFLGGVVTGQTGSNTAFSNMQPYEVDRFIICISGYFPSRS